MRKRSPEENLSPKISQRENSIKKVEQMIERNRKLMNAYDSNKNREQLKETLRMQIK